MDKTFRVESTNRQAKYAVHCKHKQVCYSTAAAVSNHVNNLLMRSHKARSSYLRSTGSSHYLCLDVMLRLLLMS